jgi:hypothetical protein
VTRVPAVPRPGGLLAALAGAATVLALAMERADLMVALGLLALGLLCSEHPRAYRAGVSIGAGFALSFGALMALALLGRLLGA